MSLRQKIETYEDRLQGTRGDIPLLLQLIQLHRQLGEWSHVVNRSLDLVAVHPDPKYQIKMLLEAGGITQRHLHDEACAVAIYHQVLRRESNHTEALFRLLECYVSSARFDAAISLLQQFVEEGSDPRTLARHYFLMGTIHRDYRDDIAEAIGCFGKALEIRPTHQKALESLILTLEKSENWEPLVEQCRLMVERLSDVPNSQPTIARLYETIGDVLAEKLKKFEEAVEAYELAADFDTENSGIYDKIRVACEQGAVTSWKVSTSIRSKIMIQPGNLLNYHDLFQHFVKTGQMDRAWCVANVLVAFKQANQLMVSVYKTRRPKRAQIPKMALDGTHWESIQPRGYVSAFETFFAIARDVVDVAYKPPPTGKRDPVQLDSHPELSLAMAVVCRLLDMQVDTVLRHRGLEGVVYSLAESSSLTLGQEYLSSQAPYGSLAFNLGKALSYNRSEIVLAVLLPPDVLSDLLLSFQHLNSDLPPALPSYHYQPFREQWQARLAQMSPSEIKMLDNLRDQLTGADFEEWRVHSEQIANAIGLIACGDVRTAIRALRTRKMDYSSAQTLELLHKMIFFAISETYFDIRAALGIGTTDDEGLIQGSG